MKSATLRLAILSVLCWGNIIIFTLATVASATEGDDKVSSNENDSLTPSPQDATPIKLAEEVEYEVRNGSDSFHTRDGPIPSLLSESDAPKGKSENASGASTASGTQGKPVKFKISCLDPRLPEILKMVPIHDPNDDVEKPESESLTESRETNSLETNNANTNTDADSVLAHAEVDSAGSEEVKPAQDVELQTDNKVVSWQNITQASLNRTVEIVNMTHLMYDVLYTNPEVKSRSTPSNCSMVMFYAPWCPFSAKAAPHFNALPRAYPTLRVAAIDSSMYKNVNTYFGILYVPTVVLFHNGRLIAKFNDSVFSLAKFEEFIAHYTDLKPEERMNVTVKDFEGPLSSVPTKERDKYLLIADLFLAVCIFYYLSKSALWKKAIEFVRTTWREAEAHHEHAD